MERTKFVTDPRVLYKVLCYAEEFHICSNRQIADACHNRIDMIWLLDGEPMPDQSAISRLKRRCAQRLNLFYQHVRLLEKQGETGTRLFSLTGRSRRAAPGGIRSAGAEALKSISTR
ncbi:MAG: transposase [Clostridia bacterium]|nr:transposase [Clostridia bacterium]